MVVEHEEVRAVKALAATAKDADSDRPWKGVTMYPPRKRRLATLHLLLNRRKLPRRQQPKRPRPNPRRKHHPRQAEMLPKKLGAASPNESAVGPLEGRGP